jgi:hypothetical protein
MSPQGLAYCNEHLWPTIAQSRHNVKNTRTLFRNYIGRGLDVILVETLSDVPHDSYDLQRPAAPGAKRLTDWIRAGKQSGRGPRRDHGHVRIASQVGRSQCPPSQQGDL